MSLVGRFPFIGFWLVNLRVARSVLRVLPQIKKTDLPQTSEQPILVSDRESAARDNGEALFRHLCSIGQGERSYFVISLKSPCGQRLTSEGFGKNLVEPLSKRYWTLLAKASAIASSQRDVDVHLRVLRFITGLPSTAKSVYLRHGIQHTSHKAIDQMHSYDVFCCSTHFDHADLVRLYRSVGKDTEALRILGMTRFDRYSALISEKRQRVIVSPTWRSGKISFFVSRNKQLRAYKKAWTYLLSRLSETNLECSLIAHPLLDRDISSHAKYLGIEVFDYQDRDFQNELASSTVFVTDFSSTGLEALYARTSLVLLRPPEDTSFTDSHLAAGLEYNLFEALGAHICLSVECAVADTIRKANNKKLEGVELTLRNKIFETYPGNASESILRVIGV